MGICISSCNASWEIQDEEVHHEYRNDVVRCVFSEMKTGGLDPMGCVFSLQGTKGLNQDSAILHQGYGGVAEGAFCGVFDGHGKNGHLVSEMVRDRLPSMLLTQKDALDDHPNPEQWKHAFASAFNAMDKEMKLQEEEEEMDFSLSGTTAVVVVKQEEDLFIANLGDSRAVLGMTTENGSIKVSQLTTDLKPGLPDEAERIRKSHGRVFALDTEPHIQRVWMPEENYPGLAMSRSFGDFDLKKHGIISTPQVSHHRISSNDRFLVLATDGVWDAMSNEEVASIVRGARSQAEAAKEVVSEARKAWARKFRFAKVDDITALCLFFNTAADIDTGGAN